MAQSAFEAHGEGYGVAAETHSSYSSAFTLPITADTYGKPIPISRGRRPITGQLLWSTSVLQETKTTTTEYETTYSPFDAYEVAQGIIVPPPPPDPVTTVETTAMTVDCAIGFGMPLNSEVNPRIMQIRAGSTIVYDASDETITQLKSLGMTLYNGSETQLPDPLMESYLGVGNVSAMRGEIYVVFKQLDLLAFGGTFPEFTVIMSDDSSGELEPLNLSDTTVQASFLVPDWTRNLIYIKQDAAHIIEVWDARRFTKIFEMPAFASMPLSGNLDACHWLNYLIAFVDGETSVIDASTGAIINSDGELADTWLHISQIVMMGADAPIWYVFAQSFFGPMVMYRLDDLGQLVLAGRNNDFDPMEAVCRGPVYSGRSTIFMGEGSKIYKFDLGPELDSREPDAFGNYAIPYVSTSAAVLHWVELNDFEVKPGETVTNIGQITYYEPDNALIIYCRTSGSDGVVVKLGAEDGKVAWATIIDSQPPGIANFPGCHSRIVGSFLNFQENSGTFFQINCDTGEYTDLGLSSPSAPSDYSLWDGETASFWLEATSDDKLKQVSGAVAAGGRLPLATLIEEVAIFAGFLETDIIIDAAITNIVDGFIMENGVDTDFWTLTRTWGQAFLFAVYESGNGIEFRSIVEVTETPTYDFELTIDDLATLAPTTFPVNAEGDPFGNAAIISTRAPDQEVVDYVKMTYKDIGYDDGENTVYRQRARVPGDDYIKGKDLTIAIPEIIMLTDEASSLVSNILFNEIVQRTTHEWRLPGVYGHTLPGDKYSITIGEFNYKIKVIDLTYHYDYSLSLRGRDYYSDVSLIVTAGQTPYTPPLAPVQDSRSQIVVFDTPLLFREDELGNNIISVYYGVAGFGQDGWLMSSVYRSETGGLYELIDKVDRELIMGRCVTVLADPGDYSTIDEYNSFELLLETGNPAAFHTISEDSWHSGGFLAVIGAPGRWEVVSIKNFVVIDLDEGRFTCSMFIRGLRDTYMNMGNHVAGDRVIFPRANRARRLLREDASEFGETVLYKAAGADQDLLSAPRASVTLSAEIQRPMSVVGYRAVKDTGDDDITLTWNRQSRLAYPFSESGPEQSVNEFSELQYLLEIKDGPAGTIVRTATVNGDSEYIYTAANQVTDGFASTPDRLTFQVTQQDDTLEFVGRTVERSVIVER